MMYYEVDPTVLPAVVKVVQDAETMLSVLIGEKVVVKVSCTGPANGSLEAHIAEKVCQAFNVSWFRIKSTSRKQDIAMARHAYCYLMRRYTNHSLRQIADMLGGRNHTTIMHSVETVRDLLRSEFTPLSKPLNVIINECKALQNKAQA